MARLFAHERRNRILEILQKKQRATVKELSQAVGVSEATLRTDLNVLEKEGHLIRTHGGAMIDESIPSEKSFVERERKNKLLFVNTTERAETDFLFFWYI